MNIKTSFVVICVFVSVLLLVGFLTVFVITSNSSSDDLQEEIVSEETTTLWNGADLNFVLKPAVIIDAPKLCKDKEKYDTASKICRKVY